MFILKKGAMFGLDARIALAIFGALSVISGAALYSAIQESKAISMLSSLKELAKAYEAYYVDTGVHAKQHDSSTIEGKVIFSNIDSTSGWNGPYFTGGNFISDFRLMSAVKNGGDVYFKLGDIADGWTYISCTTDCHVWVEINGDNTANGLDTNLLEAVDKMVDGSVAHDSGRIRISKETLSSSGANRGHIYYRVMKYN
tara:strand:- start:288 stop:884 length:597 start_codon:yes stop_codon:yes gene_type:complete